MGRKLIIFFTVSSVLAVILSFILTRLGWTLDLGKSITLTNQEKCSLINGVLAAEDITRLTPTLLLTGSDDRYKLWHDKNYGVKTESGSIYSISIPDKKAMKLEIKGYPEDVAFHPHGIFVVHQSGSLVDSQSSKRKNSDPILLYVINHAYNKGGERIDVMKIVGDLEFSKVGLEYLFSIQDSLFEQNMGTLNDVVIVEKGKFYVSSYLPIRDGVNGRFDKVAVLDLSSIWIQNTKVLYCEHDDQGHSKCKDTHHRFNMANGISRDLSGNEIVVVDLFNKELVFFERKSSGDIHQIDNYDLPHSVDNIELDQFSSTTNEQVWQLGSIPYIKSAAALNTKSYGGTLQLKLQRSDQQVRNYTVEDAVVHDGQILNHISSGIIVGEVSVMGSWSDDGVMLCQLK